MAQTKTSLSEASKSSVNPPVNLGGEWAPARQSDWLDYLLVTAATVGTLALMFQIP